jgi:hypothetical protein
VPAEPRTTVDHKPTKLRPKAKNNPTPTTPNPQPPTTSCGRKSELAGGPGAPCRGTTTIAIPHPDDNREAPHRGTSAVPTPTLVGGPGRQLGRRAGPGQVRLLEPEGTESGGDLLSQGVSAQVPSALEGLTSVFGMGTGVTPPLSPPKPIDVSQHRSTPNGAETPENSTASTSYHKPSAD